MLRLHAHRYHRPETVEDAVALLAEHGDNALPIAGGTDLVPNMKHGLFAPSHLVSLGRVEGLREVSAEGSEVVIGSGVTLTALSRQPQVRLALDALADAAAHVAGPQIRNRGTLGGNVCLETRCTYYNQTRFWRDALGYCLKKDGEVCHVTRVGKKCVAAHSADTPPVLEVFGAEVDLHGPEGARTIPMEDFFVADGIANTRRDPGEIVIRIRIPKPGVNTRTVYQKLRQRKAVDFPLLTIAASVTADWGAAADGGPAPTPGPIESVRIVVTALGSRPRRISGIDEVIGRALDDEAIDFIAERAWKQCHPLENIIVDPEWRRAMVPVQMKRALRRIAGGEGGPAPRTRPG